MPTQSAHQEKRMRTRKLFSLMINLQDKVQERFFALVHEIKAAAPHSYLECQDIYKLSAKSGANKTDRTK